MSDLLNILGHLNQKHSRLCKADLRFFKESGKSIMYFELTKSSFVHMAFIEACSSENSTKLKKEEDPSSSKFTEAIGFRFAHVFVRCGSAK